jgi:hypothetical protein
MLTKSLVTETRDSILLPFFLSLAPQPSLGLGLLLKIWLNFLEASQQFSFLQGRVVSPTPNPHPGGPGLCIYIFQRQGGYRYQNPAIGHDPEQVALISHLYSVSPCDPSLCYPHNSFPVFQVDLARSLPTKIQYFLSSHLSYMANSL